MAVDARERLLLFDIGMAKSFTIVQLRYFAAVAATENMTEAARRLNISQSALSSAIAQLERELEAQLFLRKAQRGIVLTAGGRLLAQECRAFLDQADGLYDAVHKTAHELEGELIVGMFAPIASFRAPHILREFERRYPKVRVIFVEGDLEYLRGELLSGRCELAVLYDIGVTDEMESVTVEMISPHIVLPADHPLAIGTERVLSLGELAEEPYILLDLPRTREYYLSIFASHGITPKIRHRVTGYETVRAYVADGFGYSMLNQRLPGTWTYAGRDVAIRDLEGDHQPIGVDVAWAAGMQLTRRGIAFLEVCRSSLGV